jgi:adenosylmethionine-8-amino-7-oxononanoate aminotransferase
MRVNDGNCMTSASLWLPYRQMKTAPPPLEAVATHGVRIVLRDGRELIDGTSSWWTACHGYNHPHIRDAVEGQLSRMPHVMLGGLVNPPAAALAARLAALLPGGLDHVFFSESGSVSVEIAMKMAIQYWRNRGIDGRKRMLSFRHGYHGDTFAAMSVSDPEEGMHAVFRGALLEQVVAPVPTDDATASELDRTVAAHAHELAAIIVEPLVQAAGGMRFHTPQALRHIAELAKRYDLLVIFDEIATGFGRTGSMFACEQAAIVPDIITLSKALTGGTLPLAATVASTRVFEAFWSDRFEAALLHGPTYAGNALACAAANASLDLFEREPRLAQVAAIEAQLRRELARCAELPGVLEVRVRGAIGVVELAAQPDLEALRARFVEANVWVRPFGRVVYLMPPLVIDPHDLTTLTSAVWRVLGSALSS